MKNALAFFLFILFFSGSLLPKVGLEQSFKANELLKHFQDHQKLSPQGISFSDFIWLHYSADSKHTKTTKHPTLPTFDMSGAVGYVIPSFSLLIFISIVLAYIVRLRTRWENQYHFSFVRVLIAPPRF
jgi:hypothetical protein